MVTSIERVAVHEGAGVHDVLPRLLAALRGEAPMVPYAAGSPPPLLPRHEGQLPLGTALVLGTSGSTGRPKLAMLTADALLASADATLRRLGGPGQWLLAVPAHHVAGMQVLVRSLMADIPPVVLNLRDGFTVAGFVEATSRMDQERRYVSLVPTQLTRLLDDPAGTTALRAFHSVLVGGAAVSPRMLSRAAAEGVHVLTTYGSSETCGGCVYNGLPLAGVEIEADKDGRLHIAGPMLASGYLGRPDLTEANFITYEHGERWFRTDDVGHRDTQGRWHVDGRVDDLINTGGLKIAPRMVEEAIIEHFPQVRECVVVGVPDVEWGQSVRAAVVLRDPDFPLRSAEAREGLRGILPSYALPRGVHTFEHLPLKGVGKPDRRAIAERLSRH
ncbi:MAG: o-succinylbenzoate--CoA ligase [Micrococcales bacterium]|nr:o-succinylbenzoate--CoA ligase [Micrococcales bacterium]